MQSCQDFIDEPSAMQRALTIISNKNNSTKMHLLISPKYHCEIAGEGIEYDWGI